MRYRTDLEVVLLDSPGAHKALAGLFLLSLVADVEMLLPKAAFLSVANLVNSWGAGAHLLGSAIEIAVFIGATLLWLLMLYICLHTPERSVGLRLVWALVFVFTLWWGAQVYYLFPFRRFLKARRQPV
jgi:hypothetical protein